VRDAATRKYSLSYLPTGAELTARNEAKERS
jgi:hypothetical protein